MSFSLNEIGFFVKIGDRIFQFLVGRLLDFSSDASFSSRHLVVSYLDSRLTLVTFRPAPQSFSGGGGGRTELAECETPMDRREARVALVDVMGPAARR